MVCFMTYLFTEPMYRVRRPIAQFEVYYYVYFISTELFYPTICNRPIPALHTVSDQFDRLLNIRSVLPVGQFTRSSRRA